MIKLSGCRLSESAFSDGNRRWEATDLVQYAKGLPVYKLPLKYLDLSIMPFTVTNVISLANHIKRVNETDLAYPVIVGPSGNILDGWHRVVKALLAGQEFVKAVRLTTMPPASE